MARYEGLVHKKLPPDSVIHTRRPVPPATSDEETESESYEERGLGQLLDQIGNIARQAENRSNPVDEYNSAAISGAGSSASLSVPPTYEYMPEKIESIIITGPAGGIVLVLGDRQWSLTIPTSGILVIAPLALILGRGDARMLTSGTPGAYTLELMGIADRRFAI